MTSPLGNHSFFFNFGGNQGQPTDNASPAWDTFDPNQDFTFGPFINTDRDNPIGWENTNPNIGIPGLNDILKQQIQQLATSNGGFNEYTKSTDLNKQALEDLKTMLPKLGDGSGVIVRGDMEAALSDTSDKFSDKEKAEINYILNVKQNSDPNSDLWTTLNGADDLVSTKDIDPALTKDLAPDSADMHNDGLTPYK
jgi:hypothetical protein